MKTTTITALAALALGLLTSAASADSFLTPHKQSGFRDLTGCDAATRKKVTNDNGDSYWLMQCPGKPAGERAADIAEAKAREKAQHDSPAS